ncbi:D-alanine--D-alanine ligase [Paenibacillus spiritus]|uniref:D-alanine--D-alanine ligase n=1 Tax=Paenibacillus spiritus TaxID=2496557 RepID=A0A5J5GJR6_9BACL|nr:MULTISPECIES: D-alanine--D-alanine ligase [Paenibacillus]KAA9008506.1 D-alanine--D-alanine ligase [Paenibacillus spiritus]
MRVGVIMGGVSGEREVSLKTGAEMLAALDPRRYEAVPVVIDRKEELAEKVKGLDAALLALHGAFGEDGTVQGALEALGIPYTGCGVLPSALCMDKDLSKTLLRAAGVPTPDWVVWRRPGDVREESVQELGGYPVVVKPVSGGSSIGTFIVRGAEELRAAAAEAFACGGPVMAERWIKGEEITCSVLDGRLLPVIAIRPKSSDWFDYRAKYEAGGAEELAVELPEPLAGSVERTALACWKTLRCSVYGRIDMMIAGDGTPYVLELNTLPGMTKASLLPKSAAAAGIPFPELLNRILDLSLAERGGQTHAEPIGQQ